MASTGKNKAGKQQNVPVKSVQKKDQVRPGKARVQSSNNLNFSERMDQWVSKHLNLVFYISLFFSILFGAYLFDVKISTGGDDSHYIEMANDFIKGRAFPTWHGPLYSVFLSIPMLIFGVKVVALKLFSFVFILAHLVLFYYTFRKHVSPAIFALVMLVISVNSTILYFASQTYSEAMYMFLQSLVVFLFIRIYQSLQSDTAFAMKKQVRQWLVIGFFVFLASLTRNIGIVALLVMLFFLLIERKYLASMLLLFSYLIYLIPFKIYKALVWDAGRPKGASQLSEILLKNPYNRAQGSEDLSGMIIRLFENARLYLSKHFMIGLGLQDPSSVDKSWFVTLLVVCLFGIALIYAVKHSRIMLFVALYLGTSITATCIALQQSWDQMRMVVIYIPMLLLLLSWGIQQLAGKKGLGFISVLLPFILVLIFFKTLGQSADKMKANRKVLVKNLSGNLYYGFTPDWQNYLLMSRWVGDNIPDTAVVASRKPSMSFIYSKGRDFYGIYRFPQEEPERLVNDIKARAGEMLVIPNKEFDGTFPPAVKLSLKQAALAYVAEGNEIYGLYSTQDPIGNALKKAVENYRVETLTTDSLLHRVRISSESCFAVSPDSLINTLRKNRVSYVIVASLRANPNMNTGNIINNIQRYLYFVEQKYPGILTLIHQIGNETEEPAWLYRIDYTTYNL
jgi:hypothetical protein